MDMIGHQAIGMNGARAFLTKLIKTPQVRLAVGRRTKTSGTIVATLDHVHGDTGQREARLPGHNPANAAAPKPLTELGL
jgi:hypothetical protein